MQKAARLISGRQHHKMKQLSIEQIKNSRVKALQNANELIEDADILFKGERWPRVLFLCQISGEEIGKYIMLSSLLVQQISEKEIDWKRIWKRLTSHTEKYELATYMENIYLGKDQSADRNAFWEYNKMLKDESKDLDRFKQNSLYADFTGENTHCPSDIIGKEIAESALKWAKGRINIFNILEEGIQQADVPERINKAFIEKVKIDLGIKGI